MLRAGQAQSMTRHADGLACAAALAAALCAGVHATAGRQAIGDAARGKAIGESGDCYGCHRIGERGSHVGPDLSTIGGRRTADRLTASLVTPDAEVLPENRYARIVTKDGAATTGRLLNQDALSVQIISTKDELRSFPRADLREYTILTSGLMPSVSGKLTDAQIADVVAYLETLKNP
jgi:putative heme-binding domain-containing protein